MTPIREAIVPIISRYRAIIEVNIYCDEQEHDLRLSLNNLRWMCNIMLENTEQMPEDKLNRWLGFIQGCLAMRDLIDVDEEREFSRKLFHKAYEELGQTCDMYYCGERNRD